MYSTNPCGIVFNAGYLDRGARYDDHRRRLQSVIDNANGLRITCVQGAKELTALEPELAAVIKNRRAIPSRFNAHTLAAKYDMSLLRMVSPIITHRMKGHNLFVSVASVLDVTT